MSTLGSRARLGLFALSTATSACGSGGGGFGGHDRGTPTKDGGSPRPEASPPSPDAPNLGESGGPDSTLPGSKAVVYAESSDTLFQLDAVTNAVTTVGAFTGCGEVIDIALDKDSNMYATTLDGLYTIDTKS